MSSSSPERKPWPMRWIVLAIVIGIGAYTFLTLRYRKPDNHLPIEEWKKRGNTRQLLDAGYQRIALAVERPADAVPSANTSLPAPGGLPPELKATLVTPPRLPAEIVSAHAASSVAHAEPYRIEFRCTVPDDRQQLSGVELYVHGDQIVITPDFEILGGGLQTRTRETLALLIVPAGALKSGSYHVTLVGARISKAWNLEVK